MQNFPAKGTSDAQKKRQKEERPTRRGGMGKAGSGETAAGFEENNTAD